MTAFAILDDSELLSLLKNNNEGAFTEIYNRYWKKLFTVAANKLGNLYEAEELAQDIFLDLWKRRKELEVTAALSSYLAVAVNYKVINLLAKRNLRLKHTTHLSAVQDVDRSTEQWLSFEELKERLEKQVTALPDKCRLVYRLSREKGLSQKQIASSLKIAEKTVESHLSKALHSLRSIINHCLFLFF
jgi:RNA polymerase sigma-70 factor (ECF subfamily)